jgi:hypothetical protein
MKNKPVKYYTIEQAVTLFEQGKKIRYKDWTRGSYIYKQSNKVLAHSEFIQSDNEYHLPLSSLKEMYASAGLCFECLDAAQDNITIEETPQPCSVCGLNDHWNSKNKSNKWVCYKHC